MMFVYYTPKGRSIHVYPEVTAQNICAESMSRVLKSIENPALK